MELVLGPFDLKVEHRDKLVAKELSAGDIGFFHFNGLARRAITAVGIGNLRCGDSHDEPPGGDHYIFPEDKQ